MKPILFFLLLLPLSLAAQVGPGGGLSHPLYSYDASGNRISRYRTSQMFLRQADPAWELTLSPNPSDGIFLLRSSLKLEGAELHVYDLSGRSVLRQTIEGRVLKLDLGQQPVGVYVFRVRGAHGVREVKGAVAR